MAQTTMIPLPISELLNSSVAPLNWYAKLGDDHYVLVVKARSSTSFEQMERWLRKGMEEVYVNADEFRAYASQHVTMASILVGIPGLELRQKVSTVQQANDAVARELLGTPMSLDTFLHVRTLAMALVKLLKDETVPVEKFFQYAAFGANMATYHSLACAFVAIQIGMKMRWDNEMLFETLAVGGLIHDLGEQKLPRSIRQMPRETLAGRDLQLYQQHPQQGYDALEGFKFIHEDITKMVLQHHEFADGSGFPERLKDEQTHLTARVLIVAEAFCSLVVKDNRRLQHCSPEQALATMRTQPQKYNAEILASLQEVVLGFRPEGM